jgi:ATP-dependent exoDNAse (exonuclease V) alpha subunit
VATSNQATHLYDFRGDFGSAQQGCSGIHRRLGNDSDGTRKADCGFASTAGAQRQRDVLRRVLEGQGKSVPIIENADLSRFEILRGNEKRQAVIRGLLSTMDQVVGVQGGAGTGKTTALGIVREIAEENGFEVRGLAPTSRARNALRESGIQSETLQKHLLRTAAEEHDGKPRLYFVYESSLASTAQMCKFLGGLRKSDRAILVGDIRQHQSVEAGRIFEELQSAGMRTAQLNKVVRQKDEDLKRAVILMANGHIADGVGALQRQGRVHEVSHRQERFAAIAKAYASSPENTLVVSPDNKSRQEINSAIRDELKKQGKLSDEHAFEALVRKDVHAEDRRYSHAYRPGDSLRFHANLPSLNIKAGPLGTVIETRTDDNTLSVKLGEGASQRYVTYNPKRRSNVSVLESQERTFGIGEGIQFTAPWKNKGIASRDTATIEHLDGNGNITARLDRGRVVSWNIKEFNHLDYAYAMTSHSSQGMTVARVLIHVDTTDSRIRGLVDATLSYVATSRARYDAHIFTDNAAQLGATLAQQHARDMALRAEQVRKYASQFAVA